MLLNAKNVLDVVPIREERLRTAIKQFVAGIKEAEKDNLLRVVLFGSVARGDYNGDSDVDIFVLLENGDAGEAQDRIFDIGFDVSMSLCDSNSPWIRFSPLTLSMSSYSSYPEGKPEIIPIYKNIAKDGIYLYDAAEKN